MEEYNAIARPFTDEEKESMMKVVDNIHDELMKLPSIMQRAFVTQLVNTAVQEDNGIAKIMTLDTKKGKIVDCGDIVNRTRSILEHMKEATINLIIYSNEHEVWMQYHMGKFFDKPTLWLVSDEKWEEFSSHNLPEESMHVKNMMAIDQKELNEKIKKVMGK